MAFVRLVSGFVVAASVVCAAPALAIDLTKVSGLGGEGWTTKSATPELVQRWWGFDTAEWLVCDIDLRVGGQWRYLIRDRGMEVGFHGEYREIDAPHRIVSTEVYEGFPDAVAVNTVTFDEVDGVTTLTTVVHHSAQEHRDGHIASGMEGGMQVSYDRLEDLVQSLAD